MGVDAYGNGYVWERLREWLLYGSGYGSRGPVEEGPPPPLFFFFCHFTVCDKVSSYRDSFK